MQLAEDCAHGVDAALATATLDAGFTSGLTALDRGLSSSRPSPTRIAQLLQSHGNSENGEHRVRNVSYPEDRLHGRSIEQVPTLVHNAAMTQLR